MYVAHIVMFVFLVILALIAMLSVEDFINKVKTRSFSVMMITALFLESVAIYIFIITFNATGILRDMLWFSLALFLCGCGACLGNVIFQKPIPVSDEKLNRQEGCCCGDDCPNKKKCACPTKDDSKDGDPPPYFEN